MNEPLLKATLKVLTDGQAILYALMQSHIMEGTQSEGRFDALVMEYKTETAKLILEVMEAGKPRATDHLESRKDHMG